MNALLRAIADGHRPARAEALALADAGDLAALTDAARRITPGAIVTYSRKVFLPLTRACRDVCHYCTFARAPRAGERVYMTRDELVAEARRGQAAGCTEALFTLGDKPERRYAAARAELAELGHGTTLSYLREAAKLVHDETGLLPHLNPGVMSAADLVALRPVSASMGLMLETTSERLLGEGRAHHGSPDKAPALRLETLRGAGAAGVPFTSGLLIGIGETRLERVETLLALRELADAHGHLQEVIVQPLRPKADTRMRAAEAASLDELLWTIAVARLVLGPEVAVQTPPNLSPGALARLVGAGISDWGGVSPVTPDFVNPEAPWPSVARLAEETARAGKTLVARLPLYPRYALAPARWLDPAMRPSVVRAMDARGLARDDTWAAGALAPPPAPLGVVGSAPRGAAGSAPTWGARDTSLDAILTRAGEELGEAEIVRLFDARGLDVERVCRAADALRAAVNGAVGTYVVTRNINYTNVCTYRCAFCAFSRKNRGDPPYRLDLAEVGARAAEAQKRGAVEVCLQGGIHPSYTGDTYLDIVREVKRAAPAIHVHAFSPLEVQHGASTLGLSIASYLERLLEAGLGSLPGTAAEILDDEVRAEICPEKLSSAEWLDVVATAHRLGLKTTATIMFGHLDAPAHWARHLLALRALQKTSGGFTEIVPLPFVHMGAPLFEAGRARKGPTFREALLMHAVARLALHPWFANVQVSWVKMGPEAALACLGAGANDLGGTLMNESISRAAGSLHGQELGPRAMEALLERAGRVPRQRTTLYGFAAPAGSFG